MKVISSTIGQTQFYVDMKLAPQGEPGYTHTANLIGAMNGVNSAGSALGAVFTAWSADKYGRLRSIQAGALVMVVGAALCAGSVDVPMFLVARIVAGFGIGMLVTVNIGLRVTIHRLMISPGYSNVPGGSFHTRIKRFYGVHAWHYVRNGLLSQCLDRLRLLFPDTCWFTL